jgi:hypothetical protein
MKSSKLHSPFAARNRGEVPFEIGQTLDGVSPNASLPTTHDHDFHVGMRHGTSEERRTVQINLAIDWEYASGKASPEVEQMTVYLPIGKDQT